MKIGTRVTFADGGLTVHGEASVSTGVVNGRKIAGDGGETYVPVWCARDRGRESTTIYVATSNILKTEDPS